MRHPASLLQHLRTAAHQRPSLLWLAVLAILLKAASQRTLVGELKLDL